MSCTLQLSQWPASLDIIQWSELNDIAIGLKDSVEILTPRLSFTRSNDEKSRKVDPWHRVTLQVSLFTNDEWPQLKTLPTHHFSIGEEQSFNHVISLAWSPAGLAKNKRCALAVLTSSHVLSIWQSKSDPRQIQTWSRMLVVNHAFVDANEFRQANATTGDSNDNNNSRLVWRIRSFTWGPIVRDVETFQTLDGREVTVMIDRFVLAVTNDLGELVILEIKSPHQVAVDCNRKWTCGVIFRCRISSSKHADHKVGNISSNIFRQGTFASDLVWRNWQGSTGTHKERASSILAYRLGYWIYYKSIVLSTVSRLACFEGLTQVVPGEHDGPLKLIPNVSL